MRGVEVSTGQAMPEETRSQAVAVLHAHLAAERIDAQQFEGAVAELLQARTEAELAELLRALPSPVAMTPAERRRGGKLKLGGGYGRLRIEGRWQVARETSISVELGSIMIDLTAAEFDDRIVDLKVFTGWGAIRVIVPTVWTSTWFVTAAGLSRGSDPRHQDSRWCGSRR